MQRAAKTENKHLYMLYISTIYLEELDEIFGRGLKWCNPRMGAKVSHSSGGTDHEVVPNSANAEKLTTRQTTSKTGPGESHLPI
jgi:hypothetical protein